MEAAPSSTIAKKVRVRVDVCGYVCMYNIDACRATRLRVDSGFDWMGRCTCACMWLSPHAA